jgi:hypothetical protein
MQTYNGANAVRLKGGRAEARGSKARVSASGMVDKILNGMDRKPYRPRLPDKYTLKDQIVQAKEALSAWPDSNPAKKRLIQLTTIYNHFYGV